MNLHVRNQPGSQHGIVLFTVLIALVVLSLASVALVRSIDTGTTIAGNLAFRQAATQAGDAGTEAVAVYPPGSDAAALWRIRADGAGLGGRTPRGTQGWPGWEDAAVPPASLGRYLRGEPMLNLTRPADIGAG